MTRNKKFLLVDYGNSYIKIAIFDSDTDLVLHSSKVPSGTSLTNLLKKIKFINKNKYKKIVCSVTSNNCKIKSFLNNLSKFCNSPLVIIHQSDFLPFLDLSNINKNVIIGTDILSCALEITKISKQPFIVVSLGTVYFAIVIKNKKIVSTYLLPSISKGLEQISKLSSIPSSLIPKLYNKTIGIDTPTAFASGANMCLDGFIDNIAKANHIPTKNIILTGGDSFKFANSIKKYKVINDFVLLGMVELIKENNW